MHPHSNYYLVWLYYKMLQVEIWWRIRIVVQLNLLVPGFETALLHQSGTAKIDIALVHLCDFRHSWTISYVIRQNINGIE